MKYYFLTASLPPLIFDGFQKESFANVKDRLLRQVATFDKPLVEDFFYLFDIDSLLAFWKKKDFLPYGMLCKEDMQHLHSFKLPPFLKRFLNMYGDQDRAKYAPKLFFDYCEYITLRYRRGFLPKYIKFLAELRVVAAVLRAQFVKRPFNEKIPLQRPFSYIASYLARFNNEPPQEYAELKKIYSSTDAKEITLAMWEFQFNRIETFTSVVEPFSLDNTLAFLAKMHILEKKNRMKNGEERLKELVQ